MLGALGLSYGHKGMYLEALAVLRKRLEVTNRDPQSLTFISRVYAQSGDPPKALQALEEAKEKAKGQTGQAWDISQAYRDLAFGDERYRDEMYRWLDKAYEERAMGLVFVSSVELQPFRSDPRFIAFRKKLGLPP